VNARWTIRSTCGCIRQSGEERRKLRELYPQHARRSDVLGQWDCIKAFLIWVRENPDKAPLLEALTDDEARDVLAAYLEIDLEAYARENDIMVADAREADNEP
jgi:hypothetical protein